MAEPPVTTDIDAAVDVLHRGGIIGLPTETVYGLAAVARNPGAVRRIFSVKGRPHDHPLIVHLPDVSHAEAWAVDIPEAFHLLAAALWPGPLTVVLRAAPGVPPEVTGGLPTVALRVPAHPVALEVLRRVDDGIAAPSANRFGAVSPTRAEHVVADLGGDVDLVLDGGPCAVGVESTIVDLTGDRLRVLRAGGVTAEQLTAIVGQPVDAVASALSDRSAGATAGSRSGAPDPDAPDPDAPDPAGGAIRAPGMLAAHYAPRAQVVVASDPTVAPAFPGDVGPTDVVAVLAGTADEVQAVTEALAAAGITSVVELEPVGDATGFAQRLYDRMRQADRLGCSHLVVVPPPDGGLGGAVRDRLARAAVGSGGAS